MKARSLPLLASALLLIGACSTARPIPPPPPVDPITEPTIVGAVDEAVLQGSIEGDAAEQTGRRVGRVAGVLAAILGGPETESVDEIVDRYRRTRDAVETTTIAIAATKGAVAGAKRGYDFDLQFAELQQIAGLEVTRPFPDEIDARFASAPTRQMLADVAAVFARHGERAIDIEAPGNAACEIRTSLVALGVDPAGLEAHSNGNVDGVVLRVRYRS